MRLIDADKLEPDRMTDKGLAISQSQIAHAPTVCDIEQIRTEIEQLTSRYSISKERGGMGQVEWSDRLIKESDVLDIIDKYTK